MISLVSDRRAEEGEGDAAAVHARGRERGQGPPGGALRGPRVSASSRNLCHTFYLPCNSLIRYLNKLLENPKLKGDMAINERDVVIRKKVFSIL